MSRTKNMTSGSPAKLIITFAVPLILANLGQQFYMIVDAMIVGKGVGVEALASVGAADWAYWLVLWMMQAMTQGFAIPVSQAFGENNEVRMKKTVAKTIQLCIVVGIVLTIGFLAAADPLLKVLQTPDNIFQGAKYYLLIMYGGILVVMSYNMASALLRALGDGKTPLIAIIIAGITNVGLDALFVFGFHWGIQGAAAATIIAQFLAFGYCFYMLRQMPMMRLEKEDWKRDRELTTSLCKIGFPLALQQVLIAVGGMVLQSAINRQGLLFIAGFTATNKIYGLLESSAISLGYATTTYIAQNYGAELYDRIRKGVKVSVVTGIGISVLISAGMILFGKWILNLFIDRTSADAAGVLQVGYHYLFIMACFLSALYLLHVFRNVLLGIGNTFAPFLSGIMECLARASIPVLLLPLLGEEVLFFAEPLAWIFAAIVLISMSISKIKALPLKENPGV